MQIHYMWINNFPPLTKTGITFSSRLIVDLKALEDQSTIRYQLTIKDNPDFIENFFNDKGLNEKNEEDIQYGKITNVTTIIGKNGAGKTSILKYMKKSLPQGLEARVQFDLFIYSRVESGIEQYYIVRPEHLEIDFDIQTSLQFNRVTYGNDVGNTMRLTKHLGGAEYIYYSYLLDFNEDLEPWKGLTNISSACLMMEERRRITEEY
ncbi:hypothetical protein [Chitinophaga defluvii]|uniref:ABC transporter family protein n=1 Tax=Chitinophaga defluvii TaxID=3163343 RepID=A0ABV2TAV8_9BACT